MTKTPEPSIQALAGSTAVIIPGESQAECDQGRKATIQELGATSPLEIYLAEKMFDCLRWIRRLDAIRVRVIQQGMYDSLSYTNQNR